MTVLAPFPLCSASSTRKKICDPENLQILHLSVRKEKFSILIIFYLPRRNTYFFYNRAMNILLKIQKYALFKICFYLFYHSQNKIWLTSLMNIFPMHQCYILMIYIIKLECKYLILLHKLQNTDISWVF